MKKNMGDTADVAGALLRGIQKQTGEFVSNVQKGTAYSVFKGQPLDDISFTEQELYGAGVSDPFLKKDLQKQKKDDAKHSLSATADADFQKALEMEAELFPDPTLNFVQEDMRKHSDPVEAVTSVGFPTLSGNLPKRTKRKPIGKSGKLEVYH